jgi:hypothetical protein
MILELLIICPLLSWTPATGNVHHYDIEVDGAYDHSTADSFNMSDRACFKDREAHEIRVVAVDAEGNRGEKSDVLSFRFDLGQYEKVEPLISAAQADLDGDGVVGFEDFGLWTQQYGLCHNGREEIQCP